MNIEKKTTLKELIELHETGKLYGVFRVDIEDYHKAPGLSASALKQVLRSPATYKWYRDNPEPLTAPLEFGRVLHTMVLEPEKFNNLYAVADASHERRGTVAWREFTERNPGKIHLKDSEYRAANEVASVAKNHSRKSLLDGEKELSFFWKDPETGILCKCRPDCLTLKGVIVDYKSAEKVYPADNWAKSMHAYLYHLQAAFYLDGVIHAIAQAENPIKIELPKAFVFYAQEKSAPFLVKPWLLGDASLSLGRSKYQDALKTIKECEEKKEWPGYPETIETVDLPEWAWGTIKHAF